MSERATKKKRGKIRRGQRRPGGLKEVSSSFLHYFYEGQTFLKPIGIPGGWSPLFAPRRRRERGIRATSILVYFAILALYTASAACLVYACRRCFSLALSLFSSCLSLSHSGCALLWQREPSCSPPSSFPSHFWVDKCTKHQAAQVTKCI